VSGRAITVYSVGEALRAKMRTCGVCAGSGNLLSTRYGLQWWTCPCCGGAGVEAMRQALTFARQRRSPAAQIILHRAIHRPTEHNVGGCAVRAPRKAAA
jgi:hypothetical protein